MKIHFILFMLIFLSNWLFCQTEEQKTHPWVKIAPDREQYYDGKYMLQNKPILEEHKKRYIEILKENEYVII
jgi:hypothetical protein